MSPEESAAGRPEHAPPAVPPDFLELWDFDDPAGTEAKFRALLPAAKASAANADAGFLARLLTQIARTRGLQRDFDGAHCLLDEAAALHEDGEANVRLLLERGRAFNSSGKKEAARPLFEEAWEGALKAGLDALAVDAAHMIAIVAAPDEAISWNERALGFAHASSDPKARKWRGSLLNNLGWSYHARGDYAKALTMFDGALAARAESGTATQLRIARWCVAKCLRSLGRVEEALARQEELQRESAGTGAGNDGFVQEELGECLLALGRAGDARPHFARAAEILSADAWFVANEAPRLERMRALASTG